jgi:hypothetical protein
MLRTRNGIFWLLAMLMLVSATILACTTPPELPPQAGDPPEAAVPVKVVPEQVAVASSPAPVEPMPFDPASVSVELKQTTFVNVQELILNLNKIIQAKDFSEWSKVLTQDYRAYYSSPETLAKLSESSVLKRQGIVLKSLEDYFRYVVYPSRQNDRVDDIEFIEPSRIRAILINPKGERLVLYNLEKIGDTWKIAIWR